MLGITPRKAVYKNPYQHQKTNKWEVCGSGGKKGQVFWSCVLEVMELFGWRGMAELLLKMQRMKISSGRGPDFVCFCGIQCLMNREASPFFLKRG